VIWTSKDGEEVMERDETALSITKAVFLHPTRGVSLSRIGGSRKLTHADGVDLANDTDSRGGAVEDVDSLMQARLINDDLSVVVLVFLLAQLTPDARPRMRGLPPSTCCHLPARTWVASSPVQLASCPLLEATSSPNRELWTNFVIPGSCGSAGKDQPSSDQK
jgi:hypothetical protein